MRLWELCKAVLCTVQGTVVGHVLCLRRAYLGLVYLTCDQTPLQETKAKIVKFDMTTKQSKKILKDIPGIVQVVRCEEFQ